MSIQESGFPSERFDPLIMERAQQDEKSVSPINLSLDNVLTLSLEQLKWWNVDQLPSTMTITNSGETVIIRGQWESGKRPYLSGGPLTGQYIFSQIHFHWGSNEHEGSEHTIDGSCFPMEMHIVYFKAEYQTLEEASKKNDGLVMVVYFVKLMNKTTASLRWVASQLGKVEEPQTSARLLPCPLSSMVIPFSEDYLMYWGSLVSVHCSTMWLISRSALDINAHDLEIFRRLLNLKKEPINKNFRKPNENQGQSVFHVNASATKKHLLLPKSIEPPGSDHFNTITYRHKPPLSSAQARLLFGKENCDENEDIEKPLENNIGRCNKTKDIEEDHSSQNVCQSQMTSLNPESQAFKNTNYPGNLLTSDSSTSTPSFSRERTHQKTTMQKIRKASRRKHFEKQRIEEIAEERKSKGKMTLHQWKHKQSFENKCIGYSSVKACKSDASSLESKLSHSHTNKEVSSDTCVKEVPGSNTSMDETKEKPVSRSKLPGRIYNQQPNKALQSSIAKYFQRTDSANDQ